MKQALMLGGTIIVVGGPRTGSGRPSTSFLICRSKDVDGRAKPGHDGRGTH
jgi:hypothetical protein